MKKFRNSIFLFVLIIISCQNNSKNGGSRVAKLPYYNEPTFTPQWNLSEKQLVSFHKIDNFSLIDQQGLSVTETTFNDKIYVVNFFFTTCPGICPKMTTNMSMIQEAYLSDNEVLLMSHSVTPTTDNAKVLEHYASVNGVVSNKWFLVTGNKNDIYRLGRESYFVEDDLGKGYSENDFLHTENFVLIDKNKHIRGIYNGLNKTAIKQLIEDIYTLKKEVI